MKGDRTRGPAVPRIGIEAHGLAHPRTGVGNYVLHLLQGLARVAPDEDIAAYVHTEPATPLPFRTVRIPRAPLWTTVRLPLHFALRGAPRAMLFPAHTVPLFAAPPSAVTILDLACELFPSYFTRGDLLRLRTLTRVGIRRADLLIAISQSTADDIVRLFDVDPARIRVIPLGVDERFSAPPAEEVCAVRRKYGLDRPYLLTVGTLQRRKNHAMLIRALPRLMERGLDVDLVFAGGPGWLFDATLRLIRDLGLEERVRLLGYVPDPELPALNAGAEAFVLLSLYEGFGLPVIEALACGVPTLVSDVSSLPEVGGDAVLTVDPLDLEAVVDSLAALLTDSDLRGTLRSRAAGRARSFSWCRTARLTLDTLNEIA